MKGRCIESIKVLDNVIQNFEYHLERVERTLRDHYKVSKRINFDRIKTSLDVLPETIHKLRILYNRDYLTYSVEPYNVSMPQSLKVVNTKALIYDHKYEDRLQLDKLYLLRQHHDDILIIKNGMITDSYYANVALYNTGVWYTPATPLLRGTCRARLLAEGHIYEQEIALLDLKNFSRIRLFNAMIEFGEIELDIGHIF